MNLTSGPPRFPWFTASRSATRISTPGSRWRWDTRKDTSIRATPIRRCARSRRRYGIWRAREAATSFSTGMAAISATFFTFLRPGDRVVSIKDSYGGTNKLFTEFLPAFGIQAHAVQYRRSCRRSRPNRTWLQALVSRVPHQSDRQSHRHCTARGGGPSGRARSSRWTTPSRRRSIRIRWRWVRTWCCTAPPSFSAATPMPWAVPPAEAKLDQASVSFSRNQRRNAIAGRRLQSAARHEDPESADRAAEQQRHEDRSLAGAASERREGQLSRAWSRIPNTTSPCGRCAASAAC